MGIDKVDGDVQEARERERLLMQPWWLDWTAGLFPVILVVFMLRSFLFEPFKIPSGSMIPTLLVGDLILVNKFHYGVRLPVINKKIIDNNPVQRGDVMVFRYPVDPRQDYIKRVVGMPGDEITYRNQTLSINGQKVATVSKGEFYDEDSLRYSPLFSEKLGAVEHQHPGRPAGAGLLRARPQDLPDGRELPLHGRGRHLQGARGALLHDGRQPRQFAGLALLGLRAGREHRRQGLLRLDELRQPRAHRSLPLKQADPSPPQETTPR
jgi:signal peptidase I